jgi:hypothetical protein
MRRRVRVSSILAAVTLLGALAGAAPALGYVNWPGYQFDIGHSGLNGAATTITPTSAASLAPAWSKAFAPSGGFDASPVVYNGSVYIGGNNGIFYQLNETTGAVVHSVKLGTEHACSLGTYGYGIQDTATVAPDPARPGASTVYVTGANGTTTGKGGIYLWALDASTLKPVWTKDPVTVDTEAGGVGWASPTLSNGTISVGVASACDRPLVRGSMGVFDQATGTRLGTYYTVPAGTLGGTIWATPAASGTSTWVATGNAAQTKGAIQGDSFSIVRLQGFTKQDIWTVPGEAGSDNDFGASPTLFSGLVAGTATPMIGDCNKNGTFYALQSQSLSSGPVWSYQLAAKGTGNLCNGGAVWDAGANELIAGSTKTPNGHPGSIQALSPDGGAASRVLWQSYLPCAVEGTPSEDGAGVLAVATYGPCSTSGAQSLYLYNAHVTVPNGSGPPAPQLLKTIKLGHSAFSQPAFADGYLFVATGSNLMAYH